MIWGPEESPQDEKQSGQHPGMTRDGDNTQKEAVKTVSKDLRQMLRDLEGGECGGNE
jgi:hypothetical protein